MNDSSEPSDSEKPEIPEDLAKSEARARPGAGRIPKTEPLGIPKTEPVRDPKSDLKEIASTEGGPEDEQDRREFLQKAGSVVIGGALMAVPVAVGLRVVASPLFSGKTGGVQARLTTLDALVPGAPPLAFKVVADKTDAWTTYKDLPLGLVYVQRQEDDQLLVFSASCPHAGCSVEYRNSEKHGEHFYCPCHESSFNLDGSLAPSNTQAKRGLDTLEIDEEKLAAGEVWIRFQRFKAGIPEKKAMS